MSKNTELFKDESLAEKLLKKGFWLYLFTFLIAPSGYIIRVILSNDLSVSDIGLIYSIISFVGLISVYNDIGLTQSLTYFLPKYWIEKKYDEFKTSIFLTLGIQISTGILITFLLYNGADYLALNYFHNNKACEILKIFSFYFLGTNIFQVITRIYISFQDVFYEKFIGFIRMWTIAGGAFIFFILGKGTILHYSIIWLIGLFTALLFSLYIFYKKYIFIFNKGKINFDKKYLKTFFGFALWSFIAGNAGNILGQIDQQMVVYYLGSEKAGFYSNYLSLIALSNLLIGPILGILFPIIRESLSKNDGKLKYLQIFFYKYFSVFSLSLGLFFVILGPIISAILFGVKFQYAGTLIIYSGIFLIFKTLGTINFTITGALGKLKENTTIVTITMIINVVLNFILIKYIGLIGVVIATVFSWILMWYLSFKIVNNHLKIIFDISFFTKNLFILGFLGIILHYISDKIFIINNDLRYYNLLYLLLIGIGYYICIAFFNYKEMTLLKDEVLKLRQK